MPGNRTTLEAKPAAAFRGLTGNVAIERLRRVP